jgi:rfaE bifunctional protein kinase chain/domain/rfaE bifunctional protein nucleotidyltransferase chain/domain
MREPEKIKTVDELKKLVAEHKARGEVVVHCHGVFDLLHPGHFRHFKEAKKQGDKLIITATADRYVNKGVGRPAFNQDLRLETLAAVECIDYVAVNDEPDAINLIRALKPNVYVKGVEYKNHSADITDKISKEVQAVEECGGRVHYTNDIVFSSTELLNSYFGKIPEKVKEFLTKIKSQYTVGDILEHVKSIETLKVLVIGDAILDQYQYVESLGQSAKGTHMVARCLSEETFAGGVFAVANHIASFAGQTTLLTGVGMEDGSREIIKERLHPKVSGHFVKQKNEKTLVKKRYVLRDGSSLTKLFETYSGEDTALAPDAVEEICRFIREKGSDYDLILVSDFGNGLIDKKINAALSDSKTFLAVNTQVNSGNRGYHVVTHYRRADYISLNEPELRLTAHDRHGEIQRLVEGVCRTLDCRYMSVTRGVNGVLAFDKEAGYQEVPGLTSHVIDRVGAGDSYLAVSALCLAKKIPILLSAFIGSVAAAMNVQVVGNKESVDKVSLCKYLTTLLK